MLAKSILAYSKSLDFLRIASALAGVGQGIKFLRFDKQQTKSAAIYGLDLVQPPNLF